MVSISPFFYPGTATYDEMDKRGFFIENVDAPAPVSSIPFYIRAGSIIPLLAGSSIQQ